MMTVVTRCESRHRLPNKQLLWCSLEAGHDGRHKSFTTRWADGDEGVSTLATTGQGWMGADVALVGEVIEFTSGHRWAGQRRLVVSVTWDQPTDPAFGPRAVYEFSPPLMKDETP